MKNLQIGKKLSRWNVIMEYRFRPAKLSDFNFITSTWFQSNKENENIEWEFYKECYNILLKNILNRAITVISCDLEDENLILSYLVFEHRNHIPVLHFSYTKAPFRKLGIAHALFNKCIHKDFLITQESKFKFKTDLKSTYVPYLKYGEFYGKTNTDNR